MNARLSLIAVIAVVSTGAWAAEPAKPEPQAPAHSNQAPVKVVLASAETVRTPAGSAQAPSTPKRRLARVTSCRCGDQEAQPDE